MESFEITFFCLNKDYDPSFDLIIDSLAREYLFDQTKILTESFVDLEKSYSEIRVSLFELIITKYNLYDCLIAMFKFTCFVFDVIPTLSFATGVYELTYYFIEHILKLEELENIWSKFPVLFLKNTQYYEKGLVVSKTHNMRCILQKDAQQLY